MEDKIMNNQDLKEIENRIISFLNFMAEEVLKKLPKLTRKRYQQMITEMVHKRDVSREMANKENIDVKDFNWKYYMRYYINLKEKEKKDRL